MLNRSPRRSAVTRVAVDSINACELCVCLQNAFSRTELPIVLSNFLCFHRHAPSIPVFRSTDYDRHCASTPGLQGCCSSSRRHCPSKPCAVVLRFETCALCGALRTAIREQQPSSLVFSTHSQREILNGPRSLEAASPAATVLSSAFVVRAAPSPTSIVAIVRPLSTAAPSAFLRPALLA